MIRNLMKPVIEQAYKTGFRDALILCLVCFLVYLFFSRRPNG